MQIAGLISAMMAMIVTVALGFLLEPLPRVSPLLCNVTVSANMFMLLI